MIDPKRVGEKIIKLRQASNLTQEDLADKVFVTRQALSRWERGHAVPPVDMVVELSRIFNVSFDDLLCLNESFEVNENDIFKNHDRQLVINWIVSGKLKVNIPDIFYQLSPSERIVVLSKLRDGSITTNWNELLPKLTPSELKFIGGIKHEWKICK